MTTDSMTDAKKLPRELRYVLTLLAFSVFINYIDRGNLSIAAPMLKDELRISASQLGILLSSFFWTYGLFQIPAGLLVDRFGIRGTYAAAFLLWSLASASIALSHGLPDIFAARLVLGGASGGIPAG